MNADQYLEGWEATRRVKDADGYTLADLDAAARFTADNEYVRQAETMVSFTSPDFSQGGGALLVHPSSVDTDAGLRGSVGTADGRVVYTADTTVTTTVYDVATRKPHRVTYVIPGTQHVKASTARRNGANTPRKPDHEVSAAALRMRAYRERKAAKRERERTSTLAISEARTPLKNLSAELVD